MYRRCPGLRGRRNHRDVRQRHQQYGEKTFFGLTYDGSQSVLLMVLEKGLSLDVLKAMQKVIMPDPKDSQGMIFTVALEHLGGIDMAQVEKFEQHLKDSL